ncbi:GNAT family N-acetyltransferase [Clostridium beijerinckii]|uniref:GNAT family N-acyltransferase n=1 Tax=Clostridium beijerinckii TaxID=1520 RepID=A0AAX0B970_CLOBE|nr:GNAT family N-acetyltransferase [Clostridium beijerinckii]MBA8933241.1 putative GNAT family N-acyltransferase [Clostridium beijerinckii]NRT36813.1 putative GNAT family N-acyltransferase [Clostridium beijerinckii]NRT43754.1 putative GNAT family N-acyltransferase [Clostridium beijerinckii]NRT91657.1 putative GNAT family N-acyltransferase [Clostridium beijerinckii]NRU37442.1 putative GNAT family N-acyltransferase [Clostridium beijerinckii]
MNNITYKFINCESKEFKEVSELRFKILFKPYNKIHKYDYDELDYNSIHLVALDEGIVVAYSRMTNHNMNGKMTNIVVSEKYVGKGIGIEMLKRHKIKAKEFEFRCLYLNARLDTINFYKKAGFQCKGNIFSSEKSGLALQPMYFRIN